MNDINTFVFNGEVVEMADYLASIDMLVDRISSDKNINTVTAAIQSLLGMQKISGIALSKFLWRMQKLWPELGTDEPFEDFIHATTGLQPITLQRYVNVWAMFEDGSIPNALKDDLIKKPMKSLIVAANAVSQGYSITEEGWERFSETGNEHEIRALIRSEKGQAPRKNSLTIYLERDGSLNVWTGDGEVIALGYLNVDEADANPTIARAINRIANSTGIVVR